jgi:26S proteasome regulatory subunit N1
VCKHETCSFLPAPDDSLALDIAYTIYMKFGDLASALRTSLKLEKVSNMIVKCDLTYCFVLKPNTTYILMSVVPAVCEAGLHSN